jgi:hypothetical protein
VWSANPPDGKLCSLDAITAPPLDGKRKYTHIIVSGRFVLPGNRRRSLEAKRRARRKTKIARSASANGRFERRIPVEEIEEDKVNASFRNGVLIMSLCQVGTGAVPGEMHRDLHEVRGTFGGDRRKCQRRSSNAATREEGNNS